MTEIEYLNIIGVVAEFANSEVSTVKISNFAQVPVENKVFVAWWIYWSAWPKNVKIFVLLNLQLYAEDLLQNRTKQSM